MSGAKEETFELPEGTTVEELERHVLATHRSLKSLDQIFKAVNGSFASQHRVIKEGDEVAIFPSVSGG